jgi:hypothetical protein
MNVTFLRTIFAVTVLSGVLRKLDSSLRWNGIEAEQEVCFFKTILVKTRIQKLTEGSLDVIDFLRFSRLSRSQTGGSC